MAKDYTDLMNKIKDEYEKETSKQKELLDKADKGVATYDDANEYSIKCGETLSKIFQKKVNNSLEFDEAMQVIFNPIEYNYYKINEYCESVQEALNKQVNLGIKPIVPKVNKDKIFGIVNGYVDSEDYEKAKKQYLGEPIVNMSQSIVDDFVRSNADFQARLGMSPKIVRKVSGKCCKWCANLAGTYDYADVSNTGNDVFRRHRNCRCTVTYVPVSGKIQNAWSKKLLSDEESKNKRIDYANILQEKLPDGIQDVTKEYLKNATPGKGKIEFEEGYILKGHEDEGKCANWIKKVFGGKIILLKEINKDKVKQADYLWNGKKWDLKSPIGNGKKTISNQFGKIKEQLGDNPGGMILDISKTPLKEKFIFDEVAKRYRYDKYDFDVLIKKDDKVVKIFRKQ